MKTAFLVRITTSVLGLTMACATPAGGSSPPPATVPVPHLEKVTIVVLENINYRDALAQPFLGKLTKLGANFSKYSGVVHPSQANYIAMVSGSTNGVKGDSVQDVDARSIADLLEEHGKTWKLYADLYPGNCFKGGSASAYVRKHNPFISFKNIQNNPTRCANIVHSDQLNKDIEAGTLPDFIFFTPDLNNDGHDTGVAFADKWLEKTFGPKIANPAFMKGMTLIVTFDESETYFGNSIYTSIVGETVKPGAVSSVKYNHYNLLRTIEDGMGLGTLGLEDQKAQAFSGIWK